MKILGLGGSTHDIGCCLVEDGKIKIAIEEERLSRVKNGWGMRSLNFESLAYCLGNMRIDEIDMVVTNDCFNQAILKNRLDLTRAIKINHHLSHAASAYYTSGLREAAVLVLDGEGTSYVNYDGSRSLESASFGYANGNKIEIIKRFYGNSISSLYTYATHACGFGNLQEGKLMGLAPYGKATYVNQFRNLIEDHIGGRIETKLNREVFVDFFRNLYSKDPRADFDIKADIAYAAQTVFEEVLFDFMWKLYRETKCETLCYSGGAALNSVLNGKIKQNTPFKHVAIFPASGDSGTGIGAALYAYHNIANQSLPVGCKLKHCYFGRTYSQENIDEVLSRYADKLDCQKLSYSDIYELTSAALCESLIVGWYQDGSEIGPRALGNRSILANPLNKNMKDIINSKVKFREHFRPFAPIVLKDRVDDYFKECEKDNPFMLFVGNVKESKKKLIPAVTHIDGSARLQTIGEENNVKMFNLMQAYERKSGVPVLLNTSFNTKGEPIVETPEDAIKTFLNCEIDVLIIQNYYISKKAKDINTND